MIVFQRWGILVLPLTALGTLCGFGLLRVLGIAERTDEANIVMGCGVILGAAFVWLFQRFALTKLDKPRPMTITEKLPTPVMNEYGQTITHRTIPVVNQETGQQVYRAPASTFFFIPVRFWVFIVAAIGFVFVVQGIVATV